MLDLRSGIPSPSSCQVRWWNPFYWASVLRRRRYNMELANLMHNLAGFAIEDLRGWEEATFWRHHDAFQKRFGARSLYDYRAIFDRALAEPRDCETS
jgi:hypothetical protein